LAGQAAKRQGEGVSEIFHFALFRTFLVENRDISDPKVLAEVAQGSGLNLEQFWADYKDPTIREAVYAEHLEAVDLWKTEAVPTIIIGEHWIEGAATREIYRSALTQSQEKEG
jgi:predicted DsbA family dithiol-disulfide isomerase